MKTKASFFTIVLALLSFSAIFGQSTKSEKFKVYGNCSMCENRIEKAAKSVEGVSSADWSLETKMLEVTFDTLKTNLNKVHLAIAKVGHDTKMQKASNEVYNALPGCCKYEREEKKE